MKKYLTLLVLFCLGVILFSVYGKQIKEPINKTITLLDAAKKQAIKDNKYILVEFSGSDWCSPCMRLNQDVFLQDEWKKWAQKNIITVIIDFPNDKSKQTLGMQKQNQEIATKYKIKGFPTILILNQSGEEIFRTGYRRGGPKDYILHLNELALTHSISFK